MRTELIDYLSEMVTENRLQRFDEVLAYRTKYLTVVLEDIYQSQNASAVLRSCDCFGVQDVHIIENMYKFDHHPDITLGSSNWLSLNYYNQKKINTAPAIKELKSKGYRIIGTTPHTKKTVHDVNITSGPIALMFGTELTGLSKEALELCDEKVKIPLYGFTESFNISVSVALCLQYFQNKITNSNISWGLKDREKHEILLAWLKHTIKSSDGVIRKFYEKRNLTSPE